MTFIVRTVISVVLLVFSNAIMGFSQNTFTGTYYVDNRPHEVLYLTLTQTENIVSGNLIIATPNDKKQINGESLSLNGIVDGNQITLHYKKLFSDEVINGKKQDDKIILMFPSKSGSVINITLYPSTEDNYNKIINQWRNQLVETHLLKENQEKENETIITLDKELYENINEIKNTQIQSDVDNIKQSLSNEKNTISEMENHLIELKAHADVRPMTCYQAYQTVSYDYEQTLKYDYEQTLSYHNTQEFEPYIKSLEKRLSKVSEKIEQIKNDRQLLDAAIKSSKFPIPKLKVILGEEDIAIKKYQEVASSANTELPNLKEENIKIYNKAHSIMNEGKIVMQQAQSLVNCN